MHPYYTYAILVDRSEYFEVLRSLRDSVNNCAAALKYLESTELEHMPVQTAKTLLSEAQERLSRWENKQYKLIKRNEVDSFFN